MPTSTPGPLTAAQIFAQVSPSIAFVDTATWTGSGVLIEGGFLLTNAHVVWPFERVRVVFPDGTEFPSAPVLASDRLGDLAIIGPLETTIRPLGLVDGEDLIVGSEVFMVGYPGEVEVFPQPAITRGIISRRREWPSINMSYFQTDAAVAGGQSGGALVSDKGEVIGISGLSFSEAGFGLVASAADVLPRAAALIAGEDISGLGDRRVRLEGGVLESDVALSNQWHSVPFVIHEPTRTDIEISMSGGTSGRFFLVDLFGERLISSERGAFGVASGSATIEPDTPYFLIAGQVSLGSANFRISSNVAMVRYDDVDDGTVVEVGQTVPASIDTPFDFDYFVIDLDREQTVEISVDSAMINPVLRVDSPLLRGEQPVDSDSGGGLLGHNARLTFTAPVPGRYFIVVQDSTVSEMGAIC